MSRQVASRAQSYTASHLSAPRLLSVHLQPEADWRTMGTYEPDTNLQQRVKTEMKVNTQTQVTSTFKVSGRCLS